MKKSPKLQTLLFEVQSGLHYDITSQLRAVKVDIDEYEQILFFWFYYDGEISDWEEKIMNNCIDEIKNEVINSFGTIYEDKRWVRRWDYPKQIPESGYYVFLRDETIFQSNQPVQIPPEPYCNKKIVEWAKIHLFSQYALLGNVRPNLRALKCDVDQIKHIVYFWFYFDGPISDEDKKITEHIAQTVTLFFGLQYRFELHIDRLDAPQDFPHAGRLVYAKCEYHLLDIEKEKLNEDKVIKSWYDFTANRSENYRNRALFENKFNIIMHEIFLVSIFQNYRAIKWAIDPLKRKIYLWIYLDREIQETDLLILKSLFRKISTDYYVREGNYILEEHIEQLEAPSKIPNIGNYIFLRNEHLTEEDTSPDWLGDHKKTEFIHWLEAEVKYLWQHANIHSNTTCYTYIQNLSAGLNLRAVKMYVNEVDKEVKFLLFFQQTPADDDIEKIEELLQKIQNQISQKYTPRVYTACYPFPEKIPTIGECIFLREGEVVPDKNNEADVFSLLLLAINKILIGKIRDNLQIIKADVNELKKTLYFWFYFLDTSSEIDYNLMTDIIDQCSRLWPDYSYKQEIIEYKNNSNLDFMGKYIYVRRYIIG